jgi:hypothetical protein
MPDGEQDVMLIRREIPVGELFSFNAWCCMEFDNGKKTS